MCLISDTLSVSGCPNALLVVEPLAFDCLPLVVVDYCLKTDHKNLTYINVTFTGKVLRWKLYLQDKNFDLYHVAGREEHQYVPDALSRLCVNNNPPPPAASNQMLMVLRPAVHLDNQTYDLIKSVHNKQIGHWGLKK